MREMTATGITIDEAIEDALKRLGTTRDQIEYTILDEGKKGFLGLFGSRPAVVRVSVKPDAIEETKRFLYDVTSKMGIDCLISTEQQGKTVIFQFSGEKIAILIGKRGQTLNSLQYLAQLVANKNSGQFLNVILDAEEYRERRKETLVQLAFRLAEKAIRTKQALQLEPMPSYERKIIHTALADHPKIKTTSSGSEPNRHVVIAPLSSR